MKRLLLLSTLLTAIQLPLLAQEETEDDVPAGGWRIPKTNAMLMLKGYVKVDLIQDLNPIASPSFFDVSKIPTMGQKA